MSKTTEIDGITWWKDNDSIWHITIDDEKIERVYEPHIPLCLIGYRHKNKHDVSHAVSETDGKE